MQSTTNTNLRLPDPLKVHGGDVADNIYIYRFCCIFTSESVSEKNFENRSTFGKVMGNIIVDCFFFDSQCT